MAIKTRYNLIKTFILIAVFTNGITTQKNEGDTCIDQYTNTEGVCTRTEKCQSANQDLQLSGIKPSFCSYSFEGAIVCCRDHSSILKPATKAAEFSDGPIWGAADNDKRRISEKRCEQYSREVVQRVEFIPLIPEPQTMSISTAKCDYTGIELIVGGQNANPGEFPHMAALGWANYDGGFDFSCGGSLISRRHVLTAGHCTRDPRAKDPEPVIVRLGDHDIDPSVDDGATPIDVPIKRIHKHPDYKPPERYNDIAILELNTDVELTSTVRPACLWSKPTFPGYGKALATGWGVVNPDTRAKANELQKVSLPIISNELCDDQLESFRNRNFFGIQPTQMCAGELKGGKDTCQGDSGSPLQIASKENQCIFHVIGITSFGSKCAEKGRPGLYTRVSAYLDWIESIVWPNQ